MLYVVEAFSGIGSQAKALSNLGIDYQILHTIDWDMNAIIAYDIIHHGEQLLNNYDDLNNSQLYEILREYNLSPDGKDPFSDRGLRNLNIQVKKRLLAAIERSNNLGSITNVSDLDLPDTIDLFTYSFPCQDLSIAGVWHGNMTGIDRNANNRSGMLWEVERILYERVLNIENNPERTLPKFLLMENVKNITAPRHNGNFIEWQNHLTELGYVNQVYSLNAINFSIPQNRERVYMLSVYCGDDENLRNNIDQLLKDTNIYDFCIREPLGLEAFLNLNYDDPVIRQESNSVQPNNTPSRMKIFEENDHLFENGVYSDFIKTITTKQDRNPNSGVIPYAGIEGKAPYRTLTPRECFKLMGFDELDFTNLMMNNFRASKNKDFFTTAKLIKMAGNSIVVSVLEAIFNFVDNINNEYFQTEE